MEPESGEPGNSYAMSGKIMLIAIVVLFAVIIALVAIHLYLRWYFFHIHRRQQQRRRHRRTQLVFYSDNNHPRHAVDRGLAPDVLKSLPVFPFSSKAAEGEAELPLLECAVCLSEFGENEDLRLLPKCNHSFHIGCIDMWFHSHSTCPLCRSPVEPVVNLTGPAPAAAAEGAEEASRSNPGSSTGSGLCAIYQHEEENESSLGGRRKADGRAMAARIEVASPRLAPLDNESTQSSPGTRFASLKRLFSMSIKSPVGGRGSSPLEAGTSRGASELDLEVGISESVQAE